MRKLSIAVAALAALALIATDDAWSARGGRGGSRGGHHGGFRGGFAAGGASSRAGFAIRSPMPRPPTVMPAPPPHHHGGRAVIFIGAPFVFWSWPYGYYYAPPPYYYGPDYLPQAEMPEIYVERFDGTPTPQTPGEIYC